jgi:hypothetical protein
LVTAKVLYDVETRILAITNQSSLQWSRGAAMRDSRLRAAAIVAECGVLLIAERVRKLTRNLRSDMHIGDLGERGQTQGKIMIGRQSLEKSSKNMGPLSFDSK